MSNSGRALKTFYDKIDGKDNFEIKEFGPDIVFENTDKNISIRIPRIYVMYFILDMAKHDRDVACYMNTRMRLINEGVDVKNNPDFTIEYIKQDK
jgi:hypothetical protein